MSTETVLKSSAKHNPLSSVGEGRVRGKPFTHLTQLHRIYLDDNQNLTPLTPAQTLLSLILCQNQQKIEIAQKLVKQRTIQGIDILNFVETVLVYKLPQLTREEIKTMLGLDTEREQTRFYLEIAEEERKAESITLLSRQLRRKFGLQPEMDAALQQLPNMELEQLENLADALLGFKVVGDLQAWFQRDKS